MRKTSIFILIWTFLLSNLAYTADISNLRVPINEMDRVEETLSSVVSDGKRVDITELPANAALDIAKIIPSKTFCLGKETVRLDVTLAGGAKGHFVVPAGTSAGIHEAKTRGFEGAIENLAKIHAEVQDRGLKANQLTEIAQGMLKMGKDELGAEATLSYQMALAWAAAYQQGLDGLWELITHIAPDLAPERVPRTKIQYNITNGGEHAENSLDMQEFMIAPVGETVADENRMCDEIDKQLGLIYQRLGLQADPYDKGVGDKRGKEGGYKVEDLTFTKLEYIYRNAHKYRIKNLDLVRLKKEDIGIHEFVLNCMIAAIKNAGYTPSRSREVGTVAFSLDPATSEMLVDKEVPGRYKYEGNRITSEDLSDIFAGWVAKYPIISLEDGMAEDDWDGWMSLIEKIGDRVLLIGDDLLVTQAARLEKLIQMLKGRGFFDESTGKVTKKIGILIKLNQNGFLTTGIDDPEEGYLGTLEVIRLAKKYGIEYVISHRSKEAEPEEREVSIADLAAGTDAVFLKSGDHVQGIRRVKEDRLAGIIDGRAKELLPERVDTTRLASNHGAKEAIQKGREGAPAPRDYWLNPVVAYDENGRPIGNIEDDDTVIHFDFRPDRSLPLAGVLADPTFNKFPTGELDIEYVPFAPYDSDFFEELGLEPVFGADYLYEDVTDTAVDVWEEAGKTVAFVAETEKYKHVTFFFWNRKEKKLKYGYTVMVPSNDLDDHSERPEMKAKEITDLALDCMYGRNGMKKADVIIMNYANMDILKHTGKHDAMVKAAEAIDENLGRILEGADDNDGFVLVTADHGAGDETKELDKEGNFIRDPETGEPIPAVQHSYGTRVPFIVYGFGTKDKAPFGLQEGSITNVIPTMLHLQGIPKPVDMVESLIEERRALRTKPGPAVLVIRDGYGIRKYDTPDARASDATLQADTPVDDKLRREYPNTTLVSHGEAVGLPERQMGDSDTCHQQMGAGRIVEQPLLRIERSIQSRDFFKNERLLRAIRRAKKRGKSVVLVGMVSEGGIHSHIDSLFALLELCKQEGVERIKIHAIHDYRDVSLLKTADYYHDMIEDKIRELGLEGRAIIASEQGRGLIKDRDALNKMQAANRELLAILKKCEPHDDIYAAIYNTPIREILERLKNDEITDHEFTRQLEVLSLGDVLTVLGAIRSSGAIGQISGVTSGDVDRIEENLRLSERLWKERVEPGYRAMVFGEGIPYVVTPFDASYRSLMENRDNV